MSNINDYSIMLNTLVTHLNIPSDLIEFYNIHHNVFNTVTIKNITFFPLLQVMQSYNNNDFINIACQHNMYSNCKYRIISWNRQDNCYMSKYKNINIFIDSLFFHMPHNTLSDAIAYPIFEDNFKLCEGCKQQKIDQSSHMQPNGCLYYDVDIPFKVLTNNNPFQIEQPLLIPQYQTRSPLSSDEMNEPNAPSLSPLLLPVSNTPTFNKSFVTKSPDIHDTCMGCIEEQGNQQAHMYFGGCLYRYSPT